MNFKKILERLGFVEGVDFALTEDSFEMLEQTRQIVIDIISHEEIPAVFEKVYHEKIPAITEIVHHPVILDEDGETVLEEAWDETVEVSPMIEAWEEDVLITPVIPAWDENVYGEETYFKDAPSEETIEEVWKEVQILENDIVLLIEEYLSDKNELRDSGYDYQSIEGGLIKIWNYKNIPQPTNQQLVDLIPVVSDNISMQNLIDLKASEGSSMEEDCKKCLQFITGYNDGRITGLQILTMMETFGNINTALQNRMPKTAKGLLINAVVDGTIVTQELKDGCLYILRKYPLV